MALRPLPVTAFLISCSLLCSRTAYPESDDRSPKTPLATKQEIIRDRVERLQDQMYRMIENLKAAEPQQARRLEKALAGMGELGIRRELKDLIDLLQADRLDQAVDGQARLVEELSTLLGALVEQDADAEQRKEEIERLEKFSGELEQLIAEESRLEQLSQDAQPGGREASADEAAVAAIEALMARQQAVRRATQSKSEGRPDARSGEEIRREQQALVEEAEQLARMLQDKDEQGAARHADAARLDMADAVKEMAEESFAAVGDAQQDALRELERALAKLTKRTENEANAADLTALAQAQARTAEKTAALSGQMKSADVGSTPAPGADHVDAGKGHMDQAAQQLRQESAAAASGQQQQAVQRLEEARQAVEARINQLKQENREKKLADLKTKFEDLLGRQQAINRATVALDRIPVSEWQRSQQLKAVEIAGDQEAAGQITSECLSILLDDGTSLILPQMVEQLRDDMVAVAKALAEFRAGLPTQAAQAEIVAGLGDILGVLEQQPSPPANADNQQDPQQGPPGDPPLLPRSAELKLLSLLQQRVFTGTREYHRAGAANPDHLKGLSGKQARVARMAAAMIEKLSRPGPSSSEPVHE